MTGWVIFGALLLGGVIGLVLIRIIDAKYGRWQ